MNPSSAKGLVAVAIARTPDVLKIFSQIQEKSKLECLTWAQLKEEVLMGNILSFPLIKYTFIKLIESDFEGLIERIAKADDNEKPKLSKLLLEVNSEVCVKRSGIEILELFLKYSSNIPKSLVVYMWANESEDIRTKFVLSQKFLAANVITTERKNSYY